MKTKQQTNGLTEIIGTWLHSCFQTTPSLKKEKAETLAEILEKSERE